MQLCIEPTSKISDIQKAFNNVFPFLKIEFFNNRSYARSGFSAKKMLPSNTMIGEVQPATGPGNIQVTGKMKVSELESWFREKFGLAAQVFRRSGNLWLETTITDNWTLDQQNNHGKEISAGSVKVQETQDYDLARDDDH
jgi:hypothetical protein